jgi:hypothetical protein
MPVGGRGSETEAQTPPLLGTQPCSSTTPTASTSDNAAYTVYYYTRSRLTR